MTVTRRRILLGTALLAILGGITAVLLSCAPSRPEQPRDLTTDELEHLSLARFTMFQTGSTPVRIVVPLDTGTITVTGTLDHHKSEGAGSYDTAGRTDHASHGAILWNHDGIAIAAGAAQQSAAPPRFTPRPYTPGPLDTALRLSLRMSTDRPENTQLLAQAGPRWLRRESLDGRQTDVIQGPTTTATQARLTYWIDDNSRLHRVQATIEPLRDPVLIDFPTG